MGAGILRELVGGKEDPDQHSKEKLVERGDSEAVLRH